MESYFQFLILYWEVDEEIVWCMTMWDIDSQKLKSQDISRN